jgi:Lrp/AsnC family transcriptional regulator, regulator for asnA, asnC and gidA
MITIPLLATATLCGFRRFPGPEQPFRLPLSQSCASMASMSQQVRSRPAPLDAAAKAIVEQLQQDGRRPYAAIGKAVGLSEAAVRQRVQRLVDSGVIQIVAVTDPMQVGFPRAAMLGIRADGDITQVADRLAELEEVDYVVITAGGFDILAEVVCEDDEHLLDIMNRKIRSVPGVRSTETFVYLKLRKQIYTWGTR